MRNMKFPCLMYHEIASPCKHKFYVTPDKFTEQIDWLLTNGYNSIDLRNAKLDGDVLITFDDGHKSNLMAARLLKEKGLIAVFYVLKEFSLHNPNYLSEDDILEIYKMGHIIGIHGKDHGWWTKKNQDALILELEETANWIQDIIGEKPFTCSAPGGQIRNREFKIIERYLPYLKYIRSSFHYYNKHGNTRLNSIGICSLTSIDEFKNIVTLDKTFYRLKSSRCWIKDRLKDIVYKFK